MWGGVIFMGSPRLRLRVTELNENKIWGSIIIFERYRAFNKIKWSAKRMQRMERFFCRALAFCLRFSEPGLRTSI